MLNFDIDFATARKVWRLVNRRRGELLSKQAENQGVLSADEHNELTGMHRFTNWYCENCWNEPKPRSSGYSFAPLL